MLQKSVDTNPRGRIRKGVHACDNDLAVVLVGSNL